ncbi:Creatine kinase B-type [Cricetulus griseus]|uniref:Creatine kinase B-type n=1 Tax=Cricetulus griseus TaxID=10029 RepID=G3HVN8_CRIGR|nr:Creatine kinase B-type [Cricetulus griseus]
MTVGTAAGEEEIQEVFKDLFDPIIEDRHSGYQPSVEHKTDLNPENLQDFDDLDPNYGLSSPLPSHTAVTGHTIKKLEVEYNRSRATATHQQPLPL